jgi:hypothetical protein
MLFYSYHEPSKREKDEAIDGCNKGRLRPLVLLASWLGHFEFPHKDMQEFFFAFLHYEEGEKVV